MLGALSAIAEATARLLRGRGRAAGACRSQCRTSAAGRRRPHGARRGRDTIRPSRLRGLRRCRRRARAHGGRISTGRSTQSCWPIGVLGDQALAERDPGRGAPGSSTSNFTARRAGAWPRRICWSGRSAALLVVVELRRRRPRPPVQLCLRRRQGRPRACSSRASPIVWHGAACTSCSSSPASSIRR